MQQTPDGEDIEGPREKSLFRSEYGRTAERRFQFAMSAILTKSNKVNNTVTSKEHISSETVSNKTFMRGLKKLARGHGNILVTSFPQPAKQGTWSARVPRKEDLDERDNENFYVTISAFSGNRRRKTDFNAMVAIMVDDVGTKVPFENIPIPPTYWIETSPGNFQAWYFLKEPITDRPHAESIQIAMVAQGIATDGTDPGMKGATRFGRGPTGWNNKESLDEPHQVKGYKDIRGCNYYTAEQIVEEFKLDLAAVASPHTGSIEGDIDQLDILTAQNDPIYKMLDSLGLIKYIQGHKIEITCPWVDDHTGGVDNGAALLILPGGGLGFKCHHGHDEHKTLKDVHDWLYENCPEEYDEYYPPKTFKDSTEQDNELEEPIENRLQALIDEGASDSEIAIAIPRLAKEYGLNDYAVKQIIQSLQKEAEKRETREQVNVSELIEDENQKLDLNQVFPRALASAIATKCESDRLDPIRPTQSLIPCLASQLGSRVCIVLKPAVHKDEEWREYALISCIDIGNPSENKSQTNRTIAAPLTAQQNEQYNEYLKDKELYEECCRIARREGNELQPEPKRPPKLFVTGGTSEGIMKRISELPPRSGMLYICDELAGLLAGADQYKNGKGNFKNILLTAMTSPLKGTEERSSTDNGEIVFKDHTLCIAGSIQLSRIKHLFDPQYDESGLGSRFLCAYPDLPENFAIWSETLVNIFNELDGLTRYLQEQGDPESEPIRCKMNRAAQKRFIKRYEAFRRIQKDNRENNPGLAAFIGKCPGHLARLILVSHWIACYYKEEDPGEVTLVSFNRGVYLLDYYISQFRLLQIHVSGGDENYSKLHLYILKQLKNGSTECTDEKIRKAYNQAKKWPGKFSIDEVRQALKDLAANGEGILLSEGKNTTLRKA
ncbi:DUF3987 domain-containing protein [Leptothoe sp. ISB3NOV94-8A]